MFLHVRSAWGHWRHTSSGLFTGRSRAALLGEPLCVDDGGGSGGGGGGGGNGSGDGGGGTGTGEGGGQETPEQKAAREAQDKKLASEAANWRTKLRETEKQFGDFKATKEAEIGALKAQMEDLEARISATPQGGDKGKENSAATAELTKLQRQFAQLSNDLKTVREERDSERKQLRAEKIARKVTEITAEGGFKMPTIFRKMLTEKIELATDGEPILKVRNEAGGIDEVPATLDNVMKHKPVDDFESFLESKGSAGSGGSGGSGGASANDGIDWAKVKANDLEYIQKNLAKINAALAQ